MESKHWRITSPDSKSRIRIFKRGDGTFSFDEFYWSDEDQAWCMLKPRSGSYPIFDSLETTLREIAGRVPWVADAVKSIEPGR